ncbi:MAG: SdiA-regulated domain-containing protein [Longimicrobiales bacterium]|nr:SdiA-regulated domain-containing protein [Longimicrobiales bacterium]
MTALLTLLLCLLSAPRAPGQEAFAPLSERLDLDRRQARFDLPRRLAEVSGLAFTHDGRLLAHGDERGLVYAVDPLTGAVDRGFEVGSPPVMDDLEALATAGDRLFLASSGGRLYEFRRVAEGTGSPVRVTDTGLGDACEVEGLAYHPASDCLVLACKTSRDGPDEVRVHFLPLSPGAAVPSPLRVPSAAFHDQGYRGPVNPSGLEVDPTTGSLVIVAARQGLLFEIDLNGRLLDVVRLPSGRHPQPEGIAFGPDGRLYIADEAGDGTARLTVYGPREKAAP